MVKNCVVGAVNLMSHQPENEKNSQPQPEPPSHTNLIVGGSLVESLAKIYFRKNTKDNKRRNIVFSV